jgi:hypothetical protein
MLSNKDAVIAFARQERGNSKHIFHDDNRKLYSYGHHFILATRLDTGEYLINGDTYSSSTSRHTSLCIRHLTPNVIIPFSALNQVTTEYSAIKMVDRSSDIYIPRIRRDPKTGEIIEYNEHRLGSAVIEIEGKHYLSSIDAGAKDREGYFLVELPENVTSVDEAFDTLFPEDLARDAPHVRQGEFFFEPTNMQTKELSPVELLYEWGWYDYNVQHAYQTRFATKELADKHLRRHIESWGQFEDNSSRMVHRFPIKDQNNLARYFPNAGTGHAHIVTEIRQKDGDIYVRGTIRHPEHKILVLGKIWHRVYVNRAVRSFSASGNVD